MQLWSEGVSYSKQMGFEFGFKMWERVDVTEVRRNWVPELGSTAAESSAPHINKADRGNREMDGGRGSESVSVCGNMEEVKKIWRGEIMNGFKSEEKYFEVNTVRDGEPMKLF